MKKFTLLSVLILTAAAGCQKDTSTQKKTGSYSATRHYQTGSNIPKPYSAESAADAYDPDRFANTQNQQSALNARAAGSGGAGGR